MFLTNFNKNITKMIYSHYRIHWFVVIFRDGWDGCMSRGGTVVWIEITSVEWLILSRLMTYTPNFGIIWIVWCCIFHFFSPHVKICFRLGARVDQSWGGTDVWRGWDGCMNMGRMSHPFIHPSHPHLINSSSQTKAYFNMGSKEIKNTTSHDSNDTKMRYVGLQMVE